MIPRPAVTAQVERALARSPVVALTGPRQCGKTTLARSIASKHQATMFDLEHPVDARRLENPVLTLGPLKGLVVIDEAQLRPELGPVLRVLADREPNPAQFLLLGSASPDLVRGASESLAGRVAFVDMDGFGINEIGSDAWRALWHRGGFPRSYLADDDEASASWRRDFVRTFLERDLRQYGIQVAPLMLRRLWSMLAHYHGQSGNAADLGRSLGEAHTTVRRHIDILSGGLVVRQLPAWHENLGKRQVKSPKLYVRDSGLLHVLLELPYDAAIEGHPKLGASWEGFCVEAVIRHCGERNAWYWGTHGEAELDLLIIERGKRIGFEFKVADAPRLTRSMHIAHDDLKLDRLFVVCPGGAAGYALAEWADVVPIDRLSTALASVLPDR
ncbi:MAG: ATP-binding protein [Armatimonadetes bacterium]|nr:ATP-binding protein [Armatimonadota bacterium]